MVEVDKRSTPNNDDLDRLATTVGSLVDLFGDNQLK